MAEQAVSLEWSPRLRLLEALEQQVVASRDAILRAALALAEIQERRLYKDAGFGSFVKYCRERWGLKESRVYQLIDWARIREQIPVETEHQARRIAPLWRSDREGVAEAFAALVGGGLSEKEAVRELSRRRVKANKGSRPRLVETAVDSGLEQVYVVLAFPIGQEPPTVRVARSAARAQELRHELAEDGAFRKITMHPCPVDADGASS